jgi:hypothetical protein
MLFTRTRLRCPKDAYAVQESRIDDGTLRWNFAKAMLVAAAATQVEGGHRRRQRTIGQSDERRQLNRWPTHENPARSRMA